MHAQTAFASCAAETPVTNNQYFSYLSPEMIDHFAVQQEFGSPYPKMEAFYPRGQPPSHLSHHPPPPPAQSHKLSTRAVAHAASNAAAFRLCSCWRGLPHVSGRHGWDDHQRVVFCHAPKNTTYISNVKRTFWLQRSCWEICII
jgi:hypothetical protein